MNHDNKPLTLEELRKMDGQTVWIEDINRVGLIEVSSVGPLKGEPFVLFTFNGQGHEASLQRHKLNLYAYAPIDFNKWKCGICEVPTRWPEWSKAGYDYCPYCGAPLTYGARELLEKRLAGHINEQ